MGAVNRTREESAVSTAVAEKPEQMVAAPPSAHTFLARRSDLKLVKKPERKRHDAEGNAIETLPGERIIFREGVLRVPHSGPMRGEKGEELDSADVLAFLEAHPLKGDRFDGFWLNEEPAPPMSSAEQSALNELVLELDDGGLVAFIAQEVDGWAREDVLKLAEESLERVRAKLTERDEALAAARAEGAAEAATAEKPAAGASTGKKA